MKMLYKQEWRHVPLFYCIFVHGEERTSCWKDIEKQTCLLHGVQEAETDRRGEGESAVCTLQVGSVLKSIRCSLPEQVQS